MLKRRVLLSLLFVVLVVPCNLRLTVAQEPITFIVGTTSPLSMNPMSPTGMCYGLYRAVFFSTLFRYDENMDTKPWVATSFEKPAPDIWLIHLRSNVKWHDGEPLTSEDVKFTLDLIRDVGGTMSRFVSGIIEIQTPDPHTVIIKTEKPTLVAPWLTSVYILPKHDWERRGATGEAALTFENVPPIGSGPFKFAEWKPGEYLIAEAFDDFFAGRPYIDKLVIKKFADPETMAMALINGEIDAASELSASIVPDLQKIEGLKLIIEPLSNVYDIYINLAPNGTQNPALKDREVRWALLHTIDKDYLIDTLYNGIHVKAFSIIPSIWKVYYAKEYEYIHPNFNLTKAAEILDNAGYVDRDGDGVRETPEGVPLRFRFWIYNGFPLGARVGEIWRSWLLNIGIDLEPTLMEGGALWYKISKTTDWDLAMWDWAVHDISSILYAWTSECAGVYSSSWLQDPKYDEMYWQQFYASTEEERIRIVKEMQKYMVENVYDIDLFYPSRVGAYWTNRWENVCEKPCCTFDVYGGFNVFSFLTVKPIVSPTVSPSPVPSPTPTVSPSPVPSPTPTVSPSPVPSPTPTVSVGTGLLWISIIIAIVIIIALIIVKRRRSAH